MSTPTQLLVFALIYLCFFCLFIRALNVRSSSAAHLQDVFDGTLPAGIQFGEHSNAIVVNVLQLAAKNK